MKNIKISKLAVLMLACALAVCSFIGVFASAEDAAPVAEIETANVAYNDMVQLAFTIKTTENLPAGAELGIMFWDADETEFTVANAAYSTFKFGEKNGKIYYKSEGIPAPEMDTPIYVAAIYRLNGAVTVAETPFKYSALQYAGTRLTESDVTANQARLYSDLIEYGMNSDVVFENEANYAFVKTVNGTVGSAGANIGGWLGKTVLLRAEAKNADGEYFIKWVDAEGNTVSENRIAYVTVANTGITEYTAVFGDKADSAYAGTYDFEALETGKIGSAPSGMSFSENNGTNNQFYITESLNGDKQLLIDRITSGSNSYVAKFTLPSSQVTAVEYDFEFVDSVIGNTDVPNNVVFTLKDADGTTQNIRLNFKLSVANQQLSFYLESSKDNNTKSLKDENGNVPSLNVYKGTTMTITYALDLDNIKELSVETTDAEGAPVTYKTYTCDLLVYINGKFFAKEDISLCNGGSTDFNKKITTFDENGTPEFLLDKNCTITDSVGIISLLNANKDIALDNFMCYDLVD